MGKVRRVHEIIFAHFAHDDVENFLVGLAGDVDVAALEILARPFAQRKVFALAVDVKFFVQPVHHVGNPAGAGFQKSDAQFRKQIENTVEDDAGKLDHLRDRMLERMDHRHGLKKVEAQAATDGAMHRQRHIQLLRFFVDRVKVRVAVAFVEHRDRGQKAGDHALLFDGMAQFHRRFLGIVDGQESHAF